MVGESAEKQMGAGVGGVSGSSKGEPCSYMGKSLRQRDSKCKGPEVGVCWVCLESCSIGEGVHYVGPAREGTASSLW